MLGFLNIFIYETPTWTHLALFIAAWYLFYRYKFTYWSSRNVRTPKPIALFGNMYSFLFHSREELEEEWRSKYGRVFGIYAGALPNLIVADVDVLKKICITEFNKFPNHFLGGLRNSYQKQILMFMEDDRWRDLRTLVTPTFKSGKIKLMSRQLKEKSRELVSRISSDLAKGDKESIVVQPHDYIGPFSMSATVSSFFGINFDDAKSEIEAEKNNSSGSRTLKNYSRSSRGAVQFNKLRFLIYLLFPVGFLKWLGFTHIPDSAMKFLHDRATKIIAHRRGSQSTHNDYLKILLDAKAIDSESSWNEDHHALGEGQLTDRLGMMRKTSITEAEISSQTAMFMLVATEITVVAINNIIFVLSHHPEVQKKLHDEISKIVAFDNEGFPTFDYDRLTSCTYLDCVISETLRRHGPIAFMDRVSNEEYYLEEYDLLIPKNQIVILAFNSIHNDPKYWPEPKKFDPDRFLPENKANIVPGSYCPFGIGPRSCIGFRYTLTEIKYCIASLLAKFEILKAPGTIYPPKTKSKFVFSELVNINVELKRRA